MFMPNVVKSISLKSETKNMPPLGKVLSPAKNDKANRPTQNIQSMGKKMPSTVKTQKCPQTNHNCNVCKPIGLCRLTAFVSTKGKSSYHQM